MLELCKLFTSRIKIVAGVKKICESLEKRHAASWKKVCREEMCVQTPSVEGWKLKL